MWFASCLLTITLSSSLFVWWVAARVTTLLSGNLVLMRSSYRMDFMVSMTIESGSSKTLSCSTPSLSVSRYDDSAAFRSPMSIVGALSFSALKSALRCTIHDRSFFVSCISWCAELSRCAPMICTLWCWPPCRLSNSRHMSLPRKCAFSGLYSVTTLGIFDHLWFIIMMTPPPFLFPSLLISFTSNPYLLVTAFTCFTLNLDAFPGSVPTSTSISSLIIFSTASTMFFSDAYNFLSKFCPTTLIPIPSPRLSRSSNIQFSCSPLLPPSFSRMVSHALCCLRASISSCSSVSW